jgi:hypothetical protein
MERVSWQKPNRLNAVSVTLILLGLAAGYWMWRFFPAYFDAWTVDHVLRETGSLVYRANRMGEPGRTTALRELLDKAKVDIQKQADVKDPELTIGLNIDDNNNMLLTADYTVRITHPLLSKPTVLKMHREEKANVKRVDWDKQ